MRLQTNLSSDFSSLTTSKRMRGGEGFGDKFDLSCYVLTVDSENGLRRENARRQLQQVPLTWSFIEGVKASNLTEASSYSPWRNLFFSKRGLTRGEIAVYEGHRKIWQNLLAAESEAALVFEDDFQLIDPNSFLDGISQAMNHRHRWEVVKFFDYRPKRIFGSEAWGSIKFSFYKYPASGCVAYLISREAAARLLKRKAYFRPVDEDISHAWESRLRVWSQTPNPVGEAAEHLGGSLLESDRLRVRRRPSRRLRSVYGQMLAFRKRLRASSWRQSMRTGA